MTKEDMKDSSGKGEQECCFGEGRCLESSDMENGSWRDCCQNGVNMVTPVQGINLDQNWIDDDDDINNLLNLPLTILTGYLLPMSHMSLAQDMA